MGTAQKGTFSQAGRHRMGRALLSPDGRVPANTTWTEMNSLEERCARWRSGAGAESSAETPCPCVDTSTAATRCVLLFPQKFFRDSDGSPRGK